MGAVISAAKALQAMFGGLVLLPWPASSPRLRPSWRSSRPPSRRSPKSAPQADVSMLLANLPKLALRAVDQLETTLASGDVPRARGEIRDQVGVVTVEADEREISLYSEQGNVAAALLRAVGCHTSIDGSGGRIWSVPTVPQSARVK
jgi:hypothetical protein